MNDEKVGKDVKPSNKGSTKDDWSIGNIEENLEKLNLTDFKPSKCTTVENSETEERVKGNRVEQNKDTRRTENYCDAKIKTTDRADSNKERVKGDRIKCEKVLRRARSTDNAKLKRMDHSERDSDTERDKSDKKIIRS